MDADFDKVKEDLERFCVQTKKDAKGSTNPELDLDQELEKFYAYAKKHTKGSILKDNIGLLAIASACKFPLIVVEHFQKELKAEYAVYEKELQEMDARYAEAEEILKNKTDAGYQQEVEHFQKELKAEYEKELQEMDTHYEETAKKIDLLRESDSMGQTVEEGEIVDSYPNLPPYKMPDKSPAESPQLD